jgi:anti-sigma factor RsiW
VRSKISDQDLTDYALDALDPNERLYVESMLAVSEECRNDVYETIDLAMMLEEGFEREDGKQPSLALKADQRLALLDVRVKNHFLRRSAAVLAAAAAITLAFVSKDQWMPQGPTADKMKQASNSMTNMVAQAVTAVEGEDFVNQLEAFRKLTEDPSRWLPTQAPAGAAVFGPPSPFSVEAPHATLDLN